MTTRAALIKVQIARKDLRLADEDYRDILERLTGHRSAADCSDAELGRVLDEFKAKGWTPTPAGRGRRPSGTSRPDAPGSTPRAIPNRPADHPSARKARALWLSLWNLGEVRDPSEAALEAFARRQLGVERLQWADQGLTYKLIEALKAMAERAGWSQDVAGLGPYRDPIAVLKLRLVELQRAKLLGLHRPPAVPFHDDADEDVIDGLIRSYGETIRANIEAAG